MNLLLRVATSLFVPALFAIAGCSSSSPTPVTLNATTGDGATAAAFSPYCTATLENDQMLMTEDGLGAWHGDGLLRAAAGTPFLLSMGLGPWGGYVIGNDGTPFEIATDPAKGLVEGADFTTSCAPTPIPVSGPTILLADTKLYPNADLSGRECTISAGTVLTSFSVASPYTSGMSGAVSADEITSTCGVATMYAAAFPLTQVVAK